MTTGAAGGGRPNKQQTNREEATGVEIEYVRENCTELHCSALEGKEPG